MARSFEWWHMFQEIALLIQLPDPRNKLGEKVFTTVRISDRKVN
jgi:hypothetical protein